MLLLLWEMLVINVDRLISEFYKSCLGNICIKSCLKLIVNIIVAVDGYIIYVVVVG